MIIDVVVRHHDLQKNYEQPWLNIHLKVLIFVMLIFLILNKNSPSLFMSKQMAKTRDKII